MKKLIEAGIVDEYGLLLEHYKNLAISDTEAILLMHIISFNKKKDFNLSFEEFMKRSSLSRAEIEKNFDSLIKKKLINIKFNKSLKIDLDNIWKEISLYLSDKKDRSEFEELKNSKMKVLTDNIKYKLDETQTLFCNRYLRNIDINWLKSIFSNNTNADIKYSFRALEAMILGEINKEEQEKVAKYNWL